MPGLDWILNHPYLLAIALGGLIFILWLLMRPQTMPYYSCGRLLTNSEARFYNTLKFAVPPDINIMMKVRMADLINCDDRHWRAGWGPRISAKHIDFVLINAKTTEIMLGIELDDSSHHTIKARQDRDMFVNKAFKTAKVKLLRFPVQSSYDREALNQKIREAIGADPLQM